MPVAGAANAHIPAEGGTVLDHVGLFVPDMARAARALEHLGFALTPYTPQRHTLETGEVAPTGTANRLAILQRGYIELLTPIGVTPLADQMRAAIGRYAGAHLIAFGSADAEATHGRLAREGFEPLPIVRLQRGAATPEGERLARFSVVRVPPDRMPEGRMQFCRHHTPELVWQPQYQNHPNRAHSLTDILLCVEDVAEAAARYERFLGLPAQTHECSQVLKLTRGRLHLFDPPGLTAATGIEAPITPFIAGFALTSTELDATRALLSEREVAIRTLAPGVIAAMPDAISTTILFSAPGANLRCLQLNTALCLTERAHHAEISDRLGRHRWRSIERSAAIGRQMARTCPRPHNASPGPGACVARSSSAAAQHKVSHESTYRWIWAQSAGASAPTTTWRPPSQAGAAASELVAGTRRSRTAP